MVGRTVNGSPPPASPRRPLPFFPYPPFPPSPRRASEDRAAPPSPPPRLFRYTRSVATLCPPFPSRAVGTSSQWK